MGAILTFFISYSVMVSLQFLLLAGISAAIVRAEAPTQMCQGPDGQAVDWFTAYKLPKVKGTEWPAAPTGLGLTYQDERNPGKWIALDNTIDELVEGNLVYESMKDLFDRNVNESLMYIMY